MPRQQAVDRLRFQAFQVGLVSAEGFYSFIGDSQCIGNLLLLFLLRQSENIRKKRIPVDLVDLGYPTIAILTDL
jgi:hypothetical protein